MRVVKVLVAIVITAGIVIGAGYWYAVDRQRYAVALPPASASPEQVVIAYLHALDAHDSSTARKLVTTPDDVGLDGWLKSTARLTNIKITGVRPEPDYGQLSGTPYRQAYTVDTSFTYQRHWWSADVSFPSGYHPYWSYTVVWDGKRWLIQSNGQV